VLLWDESQLLTASSGALVWDGLEMLAEPPVPLGKNGQMILRKGDRGIQVSGSVAAHPLCHCVAASFNCCASMKGRSVGPSFVLLNQRRWLSAEYPRRSRTALLTTVLESEQEGSAPLFGRPLTGGEAGARPTLPPATCTPPPLPRTSPGMIEGHLLVSFCVGRPQRARLSWVPM